MKLFEESNIDQQPSNQNQGISNTCFNININYVLFLHTHKDNYTINLLSVNAIKNEKIPSDTFITRGISLNLGLLATIGTIMAAPNHPEERFIKRSDNASKNLVSTDIIIP